MPQFFISKKLTGGEVEITGGDARHISKVLRLKEGDWIVLSDGDGRSFRSVINLSTPSIVRASVKEEIQRREALPAPTLALALIKAQRFEWAIQKAVELGCRRIIPFVSARTTSLPSPLPAHRSFSGGRGEGRVRGGFEMGSKSKRWQKIAIEAAKQSGLPFLPKLDEPRDLKGVLDTTGNFARTIFLYEGETKTSIRSIWKDRTKSGEDLLIIGPEGGFSDDEVRLALDAGACIVSLGQQILRVETAAIVALTIWQYELGNMEPPIHDLNSNIAA